MNDMEPRMVSYNKADSKKLVYKEIVLTYSKNYYWMGYPGYESAVIYFFFTSSLSLFPTLSLSTPNWHF